MARISVGIGGWVFPPWRGVFYPPGLAQARELEHASRRVTAIEINGTFYGAQKPESFRRWHDATPEDFVFSVKAPRFATHRRDLAAAGASIDRFLGGGVLELRDKLGPILWQFPPTTRFDESDFAAFLALLPQAIDGRALRHVVEVRHGSFVDARFIALLRRHRVAAALVDSDKHPMFADVTADFVYARLRRTMASEPTGYPPATLDAWAERFRLWSAGGEPGDLPRRHPEPAGPAPRDCFVYFISGAKELNPAAAEALLQRLSS
ncbi:MAG TPA: DUF72 domain-containing protein [Stellaceae bacterium]